MTTNDIVKRLKNYKKIEKAIISLQRKLNELENSCYPKSVSFEQRVKTSKVNNTEKKLIDNIKKKDDVIDQIIALTEETKFYVLCEPVEIICKELRVSKTQLYKVKNKAIEHLEAEVNNTYDR